MSAFLKFSLSVMLFCLSVLVFFLSALSTTKIVVAKEPSLEVVINEIAWMGTEVAWQRQWIELYNNTNQKISLEGWKIESVITDNIQITLKGEIGAKSYFLLERTSDETVPDVEADQIYTGNLNNAGEKLLLINPGGAVIDKIDCSLGWFAGDNKLKRTMERIDSLEQGSVPANWKTSNEKHGTPRAENSPVIERETRPLQTASQQESSDFYFILFIGIIFCLFFSMLVWAFWLKKRENRGRI